MDKNVVVFDPGKEQHREPNAGWLGVGVEWNDPLQEPQALFAASSFDNLGYGKDGPVLAVLYNGDLESGDSAAFLRYARLASCPVVSFFGSVVPEWSRTDPRISRGSLPGMRPLNCEVSRDGHLGR